MRSGNPVCDPTPRWGCTDHSGPVVARIALERAAMARLRQTLSALHEAQQRREKAIGRLRATLARARAIQRLRESLEALSRVQPVPCVGADLRAARAAQSDAKAALDGLLRAAQSNGPEVLTLLTRWFGRNDADVKDKVTAVLARTSALVALPSPYCLYQNDGSLLDFRAIPDRAFVLTDQSGGLFGYVDAADMTKVNLGLAFFRAPPTGANSKAGAIIHETTHYLVAGATTDYHRTYGKVACLELARTDTAHALRNADNYEYFVEEWLAR